jgi:hypothetical protein
LTDGNTVVWQGDINDIASNIIHASDQSIVQNAVNDIATQLTQTASGIADLTNSASSTDNSQAVHTKGVISALSYAPDASTGSWAGGITSITSANSTSSTTVDMLETLQQGTQDNSGSQMGIVPNSTLNPTGTWRSLNSQERSSIGSVTGLQVDSSALIGRKYETITSNAAKKRELLSEDIENIQNDRGFPKLAQSSSGLLAAKYDYQIVPGINTFASSISLEKKLRDVRKEFGIQIHGSNSIARLVKYYMYNRYKSPDTNLAFNKMTTHVFFTRPDLNLLTCTGGQATGANSQTLNHSESSMVYRRYPEIFKLLTDCKRCGDDNNFNLLLSNQVESFDVADETLTTVDSGKSWNEYTMSYGDFYSGRSAGEFSCTFRETSDLSVINLLKLWITYIDNVARGAWSPSYNLQGTGVSTEINQSHVYTKTLDYGASVYVFKCGPDGEDVLYWSKYYGVFPTNTGANALSWNLTDSMGDVPKLNIKFKYSFKRDMSPISLVEFNNIANLSSSSGTRYVDAYSSSTNECSEPFVGKPFIEMKLSAPQLAAGTVNYAQALSQIRLKFTPCASTPNDDVLYKYSLNKS